MHRFIFSLITAATGSASTDGEIWRCRTDIDCNLGGHCIHQRCRCVAEWAGAADCSELALAPAEMDSGFRRVNRTSWGGGVIAEDAGDGAGRFFHMWAADMTQSCGLTSWTTNSRIVHAVSTAPTGPYREVSVVLGPFSHNPTVQQIDGMLVMAHIGCGAGTKPELHCSNGSTPSNVLQPAEVAPRDRFVHETCDNPHFTGLATASSATGAWNVSAAGAVTVVPPPGTAVSWHGGGAITNPSLWPLPNGSVLLAYSTGCPNCSTSPGHKHIGVAFGETWAGPFIDLTPSEPVFPFASEDPCIFMSPKLGTFHLLAHTDATGDAERPALWPHVSAHAFAADPRGPWHVAATPPYNRTIHWADGSLTTVKTRERPQVIFVDGKPALLVNGVEPGNASTPATPAGYTGDWAYTHVQAIRSAASSDLTQ